MTCNIVEVTLLCSERTSLIPHAAETDVTGRAGHHVNYCSLVAPPTRHPVGGATRLQ